MIGPLKTQSYLQPSCFRCFEENKCAGLYWAGSTICSQAYIDKVTRKRKFVEVVELEIGKNDDRANEIVEAVEIVGGDNETQKKPKHDQKKVRSVCTILKEALDNHDK